jgi:hypothetical protein
VGSNNAPKHRVKPDGKAFAPAMPWREFSAMHSDDELKAIFAYFKFLPPIQ